MASRKSALLNNTYLKSQEFSVIAESRKDPFYFSQFIYLINPVHGKVRFDLYEYQKKVLWYFLTKQFNIILKFRQAGLTELIAMYCLWLAMFHSNKSIMIISIKERVAKKVLRKIKFMYKNLPEFLKVKIINGRPGEFGTATEMEFSNGSLITSLPTTEDAGRSEGLSLLVVDEAAIIKWASQIWASAWPTLSTGGSAIVNSTPFGIGNWYHKLWVDACTGDNPFHAIRLRWNMHPERDINWYNLQRDTLGPRRTAQEIDGDFLTSGNSVFDLVAIREIEESLVDYPPIRTERNGTIRIYKEFIPGKRYALGADVATGRARDYSSFSIMDELGEEYVSAKLKIPVDQFADILGRFGMQYGRALLAPESNDIGLAVTSKLQTDGYPNLYYSRKLVKRKKERKPREEEIPGWITTSKIRPIIIDELGEDIRNDNIVIKDPTFVQEAYTFIYDERNKPVAMGKESKNEDSLDDDGEIYTDDSILAKAITNHVRKVAKKPVIILPK